MAAIELRPGTSLMHRGHPVKVQRMLTAGTVLVRHKTGIDVSVAVEELHPETAPSDAARDGYPLHSDAARLAAERRYQCIQPLLTGQIQGALLATVAAQHGVGQSTLRRWVTLYRAGGLPALIPGERSGGRKNPRLAEPVEAILRDVLAKRVPDARHTATHMLEDVARQCYTAGLPTPALNTLRRRLDWLKPRDLKQLREGARAAADEFDPLQENTLDAPHPRSVVELDHCLLNIVVVDDHTRQPKGRPWLTLAFDVCSRMVVGLYMSMDVPGTAGTGLCLAQTILPKETWLARRGIEGTWPCWGEMQVLHMDNAREFHGTMVARACAQYQITPMYRPLRNPHHGGHIERFFRHIKFKIRRLVGSIPAVTWLRRRFPPAKTAAFTLAELERWLVYYIVNVYHRRQHSSLKQSPYARYEEGILGGITGPGIGPAPRRTDELQVQLDFMPYVERTVQQYGVLIDRIHYYGDVLRPYINSVEPGGGDRRQKFIFKRDPRDLSRIYFLEPATHEYHVVPLANAVRGPFSEREKRAAERWAKQHDLTGRPPEEAAIFRAMDELDAIEARAKATQQAAKREKAVKPPTPAPPRTSAALPTAQIILPSAALTDRPAVDPTPQVASVPAEPLVVQPFANLDDGTSELRRRFLAGRTGRGAN